MVVQHSQHCIRFIWLASMWNLSAIDAEVCNIQHLFVGCFGVFLQSGQQGVKDWPGWTLPFEDKPCKPCLCPKRAAHISRNFCIVKFCFHPTSLHMFKNSCMHGSAANSAPSHFECMNLNETQLQAWQHCKANEALTMMQDVHM